MTLLYAYILHSQILLQVCRTSVEEMEHISTEVEDDDDHHTIVKHIIHFLQV